MKLLFLDHIFFPSPQVFVECDCGERWNKAPMCFRVDCMKKFPENLVRKRDFLNGMTKI